MIDFKSIFASFSNLRIAVIGDVMVDSYILGKVNRISPEAPVPIINLEKKEDRLGGAANVALNLVALGVQTSIISIVGKDDAANTLDALLLKENISVDGLVKSPSRKTTIKTRVIGNNQHLLRVDNEQTNAVNEEEENALIQKVKASIAKGLDAVILEDYNKGVLTERVIQQIVRLCNESNVITTVDPKKDNFLAYENVTLFKPNLKEIKEGLNLEINMRDLSDLNKAVFLLEEKLNNKISFVTLSEHGVYIKKGKDAKHVKAHLRDIADVSGAGDTVIATATACLAAKMEIAEIAEIGNLAGGIVCEHSGVVSINKNELLEEVMRIYSNPKSQNQQ